MSRCRLHSPRPTRLAVRPAPLVFLSAASVCLHRAAHVLNVLLLQGTYADISVITNGEANKILIHLANGSKNNYTVVSAAASYHDPARNWALVRAPFLKAIFSMVYLSEDPI